MSNDEGKELLSNTERLHLLKSRLSSGYELLASRPWTVILLAALCYHIVFKFIWAYRLELKLEFYKWILSDVAFILTVEAVLACICFLRPKRGTIRLVTFLAALVCTWSVINAAWLRRTGTQILPSVLLPLFRAPLNAFPIVGANLTLMPASAIVILGTSALLLIFFFSVLTKPRPPRYNSRRFALRLLLSFAIIIGATVGRVVTKEHNHNQTVAAALQYNCHLAGLKNLFKRNPNRISREDFTHADRKIPRRDELKFGDACTKTLNKFNVVIVVLEGVQYRCTSLSDPRAGRTPFLESLAEQGINFTNARCTMTHTTKSLFSLLTGRLPSLSQDIAEAVPVEKPYASLATILEDSLGYRTAFFQSAKGDFECRPGLVHNLGYDYFWARNDCPDPNAFVGYLGCDEFAMLDPITQWIKSDNRPFFLTILCSVTHDPYTVPAWFAKPAEEPRKRYLQTVRYTDRFLEELDVQLHRLSQNGSSLSENTIFCVVGDHGEAFGEHGLWAHERIAFEEALRIVMLLQSPGIPRPVRYDTPVSSIDLTPTILALLGFDTQNITFDGTNALADLPQNRKVYFAGWLDHSPAGYVMNRRKVFYDPLTDSAFYFYLKADPYEKIAIPLSRPETEKINAEIAEWKRESLFKLEKPNGKARLFEGWKCRWNGRIASARFRPQKSE